MSNASGKAGGCEQSYRNVQWEGWELRVQMHLLRAAEALREVEEDEPGWVGMVCVGPLIPIPCSLGLPSSGIRISSVAFWLLQPSLHSFLKICLRCISGLPGAPSTLQFPPFPFAHTGLVTFSLLQMPEMLPHLSHHFRTLYIKA